MIVGVLSYQDSMDLLVCIFIIELLLTNSDLHDLNNSQGFFIFTYNVCLCWQGLQWLQLTRRPCGRMADISYRRKNSWMRTGSLWKMVSWKKSYTCLSLVINTDNHTKNKFNMNLSLRKFCFVFKSNTMKLVLSSISIYLISTCQTNWNISEVIGIYWW